jgi:hypothetical protein
VADFVQCELIISHAVQFQRSLQDCMGCMENSQCIVGYQYYICIIDQYLDSSGQNDSRCGQRPGLSSRKQARRQVSQSYQERYLGVLTKYGFAVDPVVSAKTSLFGTSVT